jgi:hypothetical protein
MLGDLVLSDLVDLQGYGYQQKPQSWFKICTLKLLQNSKIPLNYTNFVMVQEELARRT